MSPWVNVSMNHLANESINQEFNAWLRILHFPGVLTKIVFYAKERDSRHLFCFTYKHFGPWTIHKTIGWNFPRFQWHLWALLKFRSGRGDGRFDGWADGGLPAREGEVSTAIAPFFSKAADVSWWFRNLAVDTILTSTSGEIRKVVCRISSPQFPPTIQWYLRFGFLCGLLWLLRCPFGEWPAICHIQFEVLNDRC